MSDNIQAESSALAALRKLVADETTKNNALKEANTVLLQRRQEVLQRIERIGANKRWVPRHRHSAKIIAELSEQQAAIAKKMAANCQEVGNNMTEREQAIQQQIAALTAKRRNFQNNLYSEVEAELCKVKGELSAVKEQKDLLAVNCQGERDKIKAAMDGLLMDEMHLVPYKQEQQNEKNKLIDELNEQRRKQLLKNLF